MWCALNLDTVQIAMLLQRVRLDLCSRERWAVLCLYCDVTNGLEIKQALVEQRILNATILDATKVSHKVLLPLTHHHPGCITVGEPIPRDMCS